jgi:hypothetical protein
MIRRTHTFRITIDIVAGNRAFAAGFRGKSRFDDFAAQSAKPIRPDSLQLVEKGSR